MQDAQGDQQAPLGVLFDSSLNGGVDQILALAILFHAQETRRIRIASVSTGEFNLKNAAFLDAVARFYGGGGDGYSPSRRMLPVGMGTVGARTDTAAPMVSGVLAREDSDGQPLYPHTIADVNDTADAAAVIRNGLTAFQDQNAVIVLAGAPTNVLSLLDLPDGADWAVRKARMLSIAGGRFDGGDPDPIIQADVVGFRRLLAEWPTRIVMAGAELNTLTLPEGRILEEDSSDRPIVDAIRAFRPSPYDVPTRTLAAATYAIATEESDEYLELSAPGIITVTDDGSTRFAPSFSGNHHYLMVRPDREEQVLQAYMTLLAQPPSEER